MAVPLILLSNDDGYNAEGIRILREALREVAEVVVCAPDSEQSSTSHAISLNRPLRLVQREEGVFSVDGTPADCVYVALNSEGRVLARRPDLVVSGMNRGLNLGNDVFYSGTVAAAREAALRGIPAIATSASEKTDLLAAGRVSAQLALQVIGAPGQGEAEQALLLNVNFPKGAAWKLRPTRLGTRTYGDGVHFRTDPRGGEYLWIGGNTVEHSGDHGTDTEAYDAGDVGVTPLSLQLWNPDHADLAQAMIPEPLLAKGGA